MRAGFDMPMLDGVISDTSRIEALIPTMRYILDHGASLILLAHQGRPKGKIVAEESQKPLVPILEKLLSTTVQFAPSCTGPETDALAHALQPGQVLLLENLRYDAREELNDTAFAAELARLGDVYVNDAFSNAHRAHASMVALPALLPHAMGLQLESEVANLSKVLETKDGLCVIVSGVKLETKVPVIESFIDRAQTIVVGGAIANTFLAAAGKPIGTSLMDPAEIPVASQIVEIAKERLILPVDAVVALSPENAAEAHAYPIADIPADQAIYDLGPETAKIIVDRIHTATTIVWNGPLGYCEFEAFSKTTVAVANALVAAAARGAFVVVGGGDTLDAHARYGLSMNSYSFVSTGGGAMLEFLAGDELPALAALRTA